MIRKKHSYFNKSNNKNHFSQFEYSNHKITLRSEHKQSKWNQLKVYSFKFTNYKNKKKSIYYF